MTTTKKSPMLAEIEISYKSKIKSSDRIKVTQSSDSYEALKSIFSEDRIEYVEEFVILLLNRASQILGWAKISQGGVAGTYVDQKVIFQIALNANASSIILCHNHPSGNLKPSSQDIEMTKKIKNAGDILDITVLDHVILTAESYFSFADEGMI